MEPIRIIINADDVGRTAAVNVATFELLANRRITSASVITNAPEIAEASHGLKQYDHCSFGVHLNLREFRPLTSDRRLGPLLNESGEFEIDIRRVAPRPGLVSAIYGEWCAQVEVAVRMGLPIDHLDSHNHVHTAPVLLGAVKKLQRRFGIDAVRRSRTWFPRGEERSLPKRAGKLLWNQAIRVLPRTRTADLFTSLDTFVARADELPANIRTVELMVHPGSEEMSDSSHLAQDWFEAVPFPVELIKYTDL